jgi:hypothetical protein
MLRSFMTLKSAREPLPYITRITMLDQIRRDIEALEDPSILPRHHLDWSYQHFSFPTGICE